MADIIRKKFTVTIADYIALSDDGTPETASITIPGAFTIERVAPRVRKLTGRNVLVTKVTRSHVIYECSIAEFMNVAHVVTDADNA